MAPTVVHFIKSRILIPYKDTHGIVPPHDAFSPLLYETCNPVLAVRQFLATLEEEEEGDDDDAGNTW